MTKSQIQLQKVTEAVLSAGFIPAGQTDTETVRIPTQNNPVYGACGGEVRVIGGRSRYTKPGSDVRVTIGPRTVNVYRVIGGETGFLANLTTGSIDPSELAADLLLWTA